MNGQTLGKMALRIKVITEEGGATQYWAIPDPLAIQDDRFPWWLLGAVLNEVLPWWILPLIFIGLACCDLYPQIATDRRPAGRHDLNRP